MPSTHYFGIIGDNGWSVTDDGGQIVMGLWLRVRVTYRDDWQAVWYSASNKEPMEALYH